MEKKTNIEYGLDIERKDSKNPNMEKYDFIFPFGNLLSLDEQKIKAEELANITKTDKKTKKKFNEKIRRHKNRKAR